MAIAKATSAQQQELLRQLNILGKDLYAILTQPQNVAQAGAAFDTKIAALEAAVTAVKAAS
ncbi:unknown function [Klebsiella phage vB_Kpn_K40PH129C1]|uniref:Uncharacterized protein n=1 Tax=Klebsiella phage vB_Kpn_K40PH129C1 TaxID=3071612 RepID=A0AAD2JUG0_9CAUD|nr:unknown function [Klebsiella phage vB_Kpn_K40PH129C1]